MKNDLVEQRGVTNLLDHFIKASPQPKVYNLKYIV
jgi:hypothetical protein